MVARRGRVDILRVAIEYGADINAFDIFQRTAMYVAALRNEAEVIDVLVEAGANVEGRDRQSSTPLHGAVCRAGLEALLALLKHGADVNALGTSRQTSLHDSAAKAGTQEVAEMVDALLRSGADKTILDHEGKAAADLIGEVEDEQCYLIEAIERMRELLANAPADRGWRRRGYLVLCRTHPDIIRQIQHISSVLAGTAQTTRSSAELGWTDASGCSRAAGRSTVDERGGGDWAGVVAAVLGLQEEGIFRAIVDYL